MVMKQRLPFEIKTKVSVTPGILGCAENLLTWKARLSWSIQRECKGEKKKVHAISQEFQSSFHPDAERAMSVSESFPVVAFPCSSLSDPREWYMAVPGPDQGLHQTLRIFLTLQK